MPGPFDLSERVALVTGSSRGIGFGIAEALASAGAHVVINGRSQNGLDAATDYLKTAGYSVSAARFDASHPEAAKSVIDDIIAQRGRLDIAVCNAGMTVNKPFDQFAPQDLDRQMAANLHSCFFVAQAAAGYMVAKHYGRIILMSSVMGKISRPNLSAYNASKAAICGLAVALAIELGPFGITCNVIAPGYVKTDNHPGASDSDPWVQERIPAGRWGVPDDVGAAATFLASPAAGYCNGHVLVVDGGLSRMA